MFVEFGDLSIQVERIIAIRWIYKEEIIENALGLSTKGKTDKLAGVVLILDTAQALEIKEAETAEIIKEWYECNYPKAGVHAQPAIGNIH